MIENFQAICIDTVYACAAFVGTAVAIYGLTRGVKILSRGAKCLAAASLGGTIIFGGMTVTSIQIAVAKTNDTQQVGGDLSRTNDVVQVGGDAGTNGVEQVGGDEGTNGVSREGGLTLGALNLDGPQEPSVEPALDIVSVDVDVGEGVVRIDAELSNYGSTVAFSDVRVVTTDSLTDGTWTPIAPMEVGVMGNAISVVVPAAGAIRFYRLQVGDGLGLAALGMFNVDAGADVPVAVPLDPNGDEDGDGISNGDEEVERTNPLAPDTDGDGLTDGEELNVTHTNPLNADTDGDGIPDGDECAVGSDPNVYLPVSPSAPVYEMIGTYSVDVQYQTPTTDGFSIYGISWPGGTGTTAELAYDVNGRYWSNAFTMVASGAAFKALRNGRYAFQIAADDSASIQIGGGIGMSASFPDATPGSVASGVLARDTSYPVAVSAASVGGPAKLELLKWGEYSPVANPLSIDSEWIGLDRTLVPGGQYESPSVLCTISRDSALSSSPVVWRYVGTCNRRAETTGTLSLWTTSQERASSAYRGETVTAYVPDGIPDSVRFTVLKLDVCVDGLNEQQEEEIGAFVGKGTADATVAFSCEPDDLPSSEYVAIETTGSAQLLEVLASGETVVASSAYRANEIGSRRFVLRGTSASSVDGDGTVKISHTASGAQDLAKFTVVEVDIAAHDLDHGLQQTVPETEEETVGAYIHYNIDDDDASGIWTPEYVKRPGADFEQESMAMADDDLKRLNATVVPYGARGSLEFITSKVSIYGLDTCKRTENLVCKNGWGRVYSLGNQENLMRFGPGFLLMAEGRAKGEGYVELRFHAPYGKVISDRVKYTCIAADCGDQPWVPPAGVQFNSDGELIFFRNQQLVSGSYLNLIGCEWSVIGDASKFYNCVAWSVGKTNVAFEGVVHDGNIPVDRLMDDDGVVWVSLDQVYGNGNGFYEEQYDLDPFFLREADMVLTENIDDAEIIYYEGIRGKFHVAKRRRCDCGNDHWLMFDSKCGEFEVIEHRPEQLTSRYGHITRMYKARTN